MNLILLHGNGINAISNKILSIKKNYDSLSIEEKNGKNISWEQMIVDVATPQLFATDRLLILENYDEKVDLAKLPDDPSLTVVIKFNKPLNGKSSLLKAATDNRAQVLLFSEKDETSVFPFLDNLAEKNSRALEQFENLYDEYGGQYLLTMIFYMLRRTVMPNGNVPSFVAQKITKQKQNFPKEKLGMLYRFCLETDYKIKSGLIADKMGLTLIVEKILNS